MPFMTHCPSCSRPLRVPDELSGRNVKCPDCGATFPAGSASTGAPVPEVPPAADAPPGWQSPERLPVPGHGRTRGTYSVDEARSALIGPGISLIMISVLWLLGLGLYLMVIVHMMNNPKDVEKVIEDQKKQQKAQGQPMTPEQEKQIEAVVHAIFGEPGIVATLITAVLALLILLGGIQMLRVRSRGLVMFASVLAVIPCLSPCCILGIPFGIWALVAVNRPEVVDAFQRGSDTGYHDTADEL
jgi:hypothetical protein